MIVASYALTVLVVFALWTALSFAAWMVLIECLRSRDELPMQHPRLTPDPPRVRLMPFDQDAVS